MAEDFEIICSKIEEEKEFLNTVSQEIWRNPELKFKEFHAHAFLTNTFENCGFKVERRYHLETAFKAEYPRKSDSEIHPGPTVAILVEYDALPKIGHACGHNLISEAGLAAAIAIKEIMDNDPTLPGKLVVMGTPAEEGGGGKMRLIEKGAFKNIDVALMVHPTRHSCSSPPCLCNIKGSIEYIGRGAHASINAWEGLNALDAAVMFYNSVSVLRQQILPNQRIHLILKEGGISTKIIPDKSRLEFAIRTLTVAHLRELKSRLEMCINAAAAATGCKVNYQFDESNCYESLISNKILCSLFEKYYLELGMEFHDRRIFELALGSTDMGNVSQIMPAYHPFFAIPSTRVNHTKEFAEAAGLESAQKPTLAAAKAMAMTAVSVLRNPDLMKKAKEQFEVDVLKERGSCDKMN